MVSPPYLSQLFPIIIYVARIYANWLIPLVRCIFRIQTDFHRMSVLDAVAKFAENWF